MNESDSTEISKNLTTEEALKKLIAGDYEEMDESEATDRFVDLLLDLIAERSEEKAEEVLDKHERDYDHEYRE